MKSFAGIFFILCVPLSMWLFLRVSSWTGSEVLGLVAAVLLYIGCALIIAAVFNRKNAPKTNDNLSVKSEETSGAAEVNATKVNAAEVDTATAKPEASGATNPNAAKK
ncbi:MAG: hypothetical protein MJY47_03280 [Fibrobacter sp.]|nr:hypothetical protein [Fibrobacter sp.]